MVPEDLSMFFCTFVLFTQTHIAVKHFVPCLLFFLSFILIRPQFNTCIVYQQSINYELSCNPANTG